MPLYDLTEFLKLSSVLNYNLSAASLNRYNVLTYITGGKKLDPDDKTDRERKSLVMDALGYLFNAYRQKRRYLGPMAVLHPLRATALLTRTQDNLNLVDILCTLFHDIQEDVKPVEFEVHQWKEMEAQLYHLMERLPEEEESTLAYSLRGLTRTAQESYYEYIDRLLRYARQQPSLIQIKLADRLDNTLDMRIDLQDPLAGVDFFQDIFQLMFVNNYQGYRPPIDHQYSTALKGARRLYQLFKNSVLLSLIRQDEAASGNHAIDVLFNAVCDASLKEAQRTLLHLLGYHVKDLKTQRQLVLDTMEYCFSGRSDLVTKPEGKHLLDGLFATYFAPTCKGILNQKLDALYQDKPLMLQASLAFLVIFLSFSNDWKYYIRGISAAGIAPS